MWLLPWRWSLLNFLLRLASYHISAGAELWRQSQVSNPRGTEKVSRLNCRDVISFCCRYCSLDLKVVQFGIFAGHFRWNLCTLLPALWLRARLGALELCIEGSLISNFRRLLMSSGFKQFYLKDSGSNARTIRSSKQTVQMSRLVLSFRIWWYLMNHLQRTLCAEKHLAQFQDFANHHQFWSTSLNWCI